MRTLPKFDSYGIDQLTLQELLANENNFKKIEGEVYQSGLVFLENIFCMAAES
ncbi:MAG: hypothetical protein ACQEP2_07865 [Actinomycetota bacterium]